MAWFSYHGGHSGQFCRHARGSLSAVVDAALAAGFTTYGISEHGPRDRVRDLFADEEGLAPDDLHRMFADYLAEARRLRDEHADRIELLIGFETEVVPPDDWPERMRGLRAGIPDLDYVIGSVHHVGDHCIDERPERTAEAAAAAGGSEELRRAYFELVARVASELRPEVLGHFDLIRKFEEPEFAFSRALWPAIEAALEAARAAGSALDVNASPFRRRGAPVYPLPAILERACAMGIPVTLGDDSHGPDDVGVGLEACVGAIGKAGYRHVHHWTRRSGALELVPVPLEEVRPRR